MDKIIREWNPRKITPVIVSFRDGTFNIVDGQHHTEAARQMAGGRDVDVPCIIHTGLTYQEEAQMYADLDTDKTPLTPRQHTKALVEAGSDPKIMDIRQLGVCQEFCVSKETVRSQEAGGNGRRSLMIIGMDTLTDGIIQFKLITDKSPIGNGAISPFFC